MHTCQPAGSLLATTICEIESRGRRGLSFEKKKIVVKENDDPQGACGCVVSIDFLGKEKDEARP